MIRYSSPMVKARAIVAGQVKASKGQVDHSRRMVSLPAMIVIELEREEAPVHAFRWVAWAASRADQRRRTDLVIYLRRSIARPRNGWFKERQLAVALAEWDRCRYEARARGNIPPNFDQVPLDAYRAVIEAARKPPRSAENATAGEPGDDGGELPTTEDDEGDGEHEDGTGAAADEDDVEDDAAADDGSEAEPISTRQPQGREHVLRHLSNAVRAAIAADDLEGADAANDAISRLCGAREDSE